jgi:type II secretory pathway pseudopilin PulG
MTLHQSFVRRAIRSDAGFTVLELMVATAIMMAVTGAVFSFMNPAQGAFKAQPEMSDMQQRLRVGVDAIQKDLLMAGAGSYVGSGAGALYNFFAPILPYRSGDVDPDQAKDVFYRPDAISVLYVPPTPAQTTIADTMPQTSAELKVTPQINCDESKKDKLCGFSQGMQVIVFDPSGSWDTMEITEVQPEATPPHLQHNRDRLSTQYDVGANITQIAMHTYYYNSTDLQLMHYDGANTDLPVIDNVVKVQFEYFGEPEPPRLLPTAVLSSPVGPWTTYGPRPPVLGKPSNTSYGDGANCTFQVVDGVQVPRLESLSAGGVGQVPLPPEIFQDGPWCPDESRASRFDADLLRIRRVRVNLRLQVGLPTLRGPAGLLWSNGGTSQSGYHMIPDQEIHFDVTPRNMNLGR